MPIIYYNIANIKAINCQLNRRFCHYICFMNISLNIKSIREAKRLTQNDIAERLGVDGSNYAKQEKRGSKLSFEQLEKIALALGVSVQELVFGQTVGGTENVEELKEKISELERKNKALKSDLERKNKVIDMISPIAEEVMKGLTHLGKHLQGNKSESIETHQISDDKKREIKSIVDSIFDDKEVKE